MTSETDSDPKLIEPELITKEDAERKLEQAIDLACDKNGEVLDMDEFHERLKNEYGMDVTIEDGQTHYGMVPEEIMDGWVLGHHAVIQGEHPTEMGFDVERQNEFSRQVTEMFNDQLEMAYETGDDPFPLRASVGGSESHE